MSNVSEHFPNSAVTAAVAVMCLPVTADTVIGTGPVWKVERQTVVWPRAPVSGLGDKVPLKLKDFYNCDVELWGNFVVYFLLFSRLLLAIVFPYFVRKSLLVC